MNWKQWSSKTCSVRPEGRKKSWPNQPCADATWAGHPGPKGQTALLTEEESQEDQTEQPVAGADTQDGTPDVAAAKAPSMLPSSIGLTFTVAGDIQAIQITARWGRYVRVESETEMTKSGRPRRIWQRISVEGSSAPIPLVAGKFGPWSPDPENGEVRVRDLIRHHDEQLRRPAGPLPLQSQKVT